MMTQLGRSRFWPTLGKLAALAALAAATLGVPRAYAQTLKAGVSQVQYSDQYSQNCEQQNANNPYVGMDPMTCHGESAPTDSRGECSLNIGTVWKKDGNTCYYCAPINPPIQGIVIPLDNVGAAQLQGFGCGMDQADACMAICSGGKGFTPPAGTVQKTGGPEKPYQPGPSGGPPPGYAPQPGPPPVQGASNPCLPFGPGGYDYCANPPGVRLPAGCTCNRSTRPPLTASTSTDTTGKQPIAGSADDDCSQTKDSGYIYCAKASNGSETCGCELQVPLRASTKQSASSAQCDAGLLLSQTVFSQVQMGQIEKDLAATKAMLQRAKQHVDEWDGDARSLSWQYFGISNKSTVQPKLQAVINAELTELGNMPDPGENFTYDSRPITPGTPANTIAYVYAGSFRNSSPTVYLKPAFFNESADYQAQTLVHELSHTNFAGGALDFSYGQDNCMILAMETNVLRVAACTQLPCVTNLPEKAKNMSMFNADSIAFFVHDLAKK
jgi:hypothetical protein